LGTKRLSSSDPYVDVSIVSPCVCEHDGILQKRQSHRNNGGVVEPFPQKLHRVLSELARSGDPALENVVSFLPHGRAFHIHEPDTFEKSLLPKYFAGQKNIGSFCRQLNLYGFIRVRLNPGSARAPKETLPGMRQPVAFSKASNKRCTHSSGYLFYHPLFLRSRPEFALYMRRVGAPVSGSDRRKMRGPLSGLTISHIPKFHLMPLPDDRRGPAPSTALSGSQSE
jgi:HSF-type DNA-binding